MNIQSFQGGYDKNFTYVVWCQETKLAAIIDPSTEITPIIEYIENKCTKKEYQKHFLKIRQAIPVLSN